MIERQLKQLILPRLFRGKAIVLTGPRQVGKTTLLRMLMAESDKKTLFWNCDEPDVRQKLFDLALKIGSDVPFCLAAAMGHSAAVAEGRGERLTYIQPLDARIETFTPKLEVPTAKVYGALKPEDYAHPYDVAGYLAAETVEEKCAFLGNHLQAPACRLYPKICREIEHLSQENKGLATLQSGSGPTIFTVYRR